MNITNDKGDAKSLCNFGGTYGECVVGWTPTPISGYIVPMPCTCMVMRCAPRRGSTREHIEHGQVQSKQSPKVPLIRYI
jgi:hypothetical protein